MKSLTRPNGSKTGFLEEKSLLTKDAFWGLGCRRRFYLKTYTYKILRKRRLKISEGVFGLKEIWNFFGLTTSRRGAVGSSLWRALILSRWLVWAWSRKGGFVNS